jgi:hypothetical protein
MLILAIMNVIIRIVFEVILDMLIVIMLMAVMPSVFIMNVESYYAKFQNYQKQYLI